ncbi:VOC family protein [Oceanicoccus sagamiensis]|uniref:Glyoxalase n=1 Tax=Oceanicoccus sagamiensis TaxID=716816 RepID=A0A1X9N3Y7_9GAMM|nr:VOC family protein [Oceanicoccus sagamiensis]ARN72880.1 glyoxalase [Oceanicoccus sagamiensis]
MKPRISMIALAVNDIAKASQFYREVFGFPQIESAPAVAFFDLNGTWLGLSEREDLAKDATVSAEGTGYNAFSLAHNVTSESEVDQLMAEVLAAGAILVKPAQPADWGGYHGYIKDLDEHLWEIAYNPFEWVGPEDN